MRKKSITTLLLTLMLTLVFSMTAFAKEATRTECDETVYATTTSNIRTGASTSHKVVATVKKDTELQRTAVLDNGWSEILYNGQTCYISSKLVTNTVPNANSAPVEEQTAQQATVNQATASGTKPQAKTENGWTLVPRNLSPNGLWIWYSSDDDGTWTDWLIAAYDATGITNDMSDYDKAIAINNYICRVVSYKDFEAGMDSSFTSAYCVVTGETNCWGYSHAFDCLCTIAGVASNQVFGSAIVSADGATEDHAWNYVVINGTKYWVDVCWNDTTNNSYLMSTTQFSDHIYTYEK